MFFTPYRVVRVRFFRRIRLSTISIAFLLPFFVTSYAYGWYGKAVLVENSCRITVERADGLTRVTLYGIQCLPSGQPFGNKALYLTGWLVLGKQVEVIPIGIDSIAETTALVRVEGSRDFLNGQLIAYGMAWLKNRNPVIPLCGEWKKLEELARINRIGLWAGNHPALPKGRQWGKVTNHDRRS